MIEILLTLLGTYVLLFLASLWLEDNSIADVFWGAGFIIITMMSLLMQDHVTLSQFILSSLVILWGTRLIMYIWRKKMYHPWEDSRYAKWRKSWEYFYTRSFFQVYILQWVLMCLVATPIFVLNLSSQWGDNMTLTYIWASIAIIGFIYELIADKQLKTFMHIKKKWDILTSGLRRYSRYPQYFWESIFWFGICLIASQISMIAFLGWIVITILVRYVSGAAMLEERYAWNKKYAEYSKQTPIFIPNFRK